MMGTAALIALVPAPVFTALFVINDGNQITSIAQVTGRAAWDDWRARCSAALNLSTAAVFGTLSLSFL